MDRKAIAIAVGILVIVGLGFLFFSNMITGAVITGSALLTDVEDEDGSMIMGNEAFRISDFGKGGVEDGDG